MSEPAAVIDTIRLSYDLASMPELEGVSGVVRGLGTTGEAWTYSAVVEGPEDRQARLFWGSSNRAQLECSLPKWAGASNVVGLERGPALEVAREVWEWASVRARPSVPFEGVFVNRVDLVRDFENVTQIEAALRSFAPARQKGRAVTRLFRDASREGALSLSKGNGARLGTLYDKHGEVAASRPRPPKGKDNADLRAYRKAMATWAKAENDSRGRMRFEARLRKEPLRAGGLHVVRDFSESMDGESKLQQLRRGVFSWCGYDRKVEGMSLLVETVLAHQELSPHDRMCALGFLVAEAHGQGVDGLLSRHTVAKYRRIAEELGMILGPEMELPAGAVTLALDYEAGVLRMERGAA